METKAVLRDVSLFAGLDDAGIDQLAAIAERRSYATGETIFNEGEADVALFILAVGGIKIDKQVNFDQQQTLHQLHPSDFFGMISFILGGEHSATAKALKDSEVVLIRRTEFDKLATRNPALAYRVVLAMANQLGTLLRNTDEKFVELVGYIWGRSKK